MKLTALWYSYENNLSAVCVFKEGAWRVGGGVKVYVFGGQLDMGCGTPLLS